MDRGFDFYSALKELVEQVPEERATTPRLLAEALGDPEATRAVIEALKRNEFTRTPTNVRPAIGEGVAFSKFKTDHPLQRLAEHQERMAKRVVITPFILGAPLVAGVDASYGEDTVYAACVVMNRDMEIVDSASAAVETRFPYISGYLSFREAPGLLSAVRKVSGFDVLMVNGHGVAHLRGCGLASLVGIEVDKPTIGVARRALVGSRKNKGCINPPYSQWSDRGRRGEENGGGADLRLRGSQDRPQECRESHPENVEPGEAPGAPQSRPPRGGSRQETGWLTRSTFYPIRRGVDR
jgi:deoxyinosine 3'endonuclease (endonuclease V)